MSLLLAAYHYSSFPHYYNTYTVHFSHNNDMMEREKEGNQPLFFLDGSLWGKTREKTDFPAQMEAMGIKCLSRSLCLEQNVFGGASPKPPSTYTFPCHLEHYSLYTLSTFPCQNTLIVRELPRHLEASLGDLATLYVGCRNTLALFESWGVFLLA